MILSSATYRRRRCDAQLVRAEPLPITAETPSLAPGLEGRPQTTGALAVDPGVRKMPIAVVSCAT